MGWTVWCSNPGRGIIFSSAQHPNQQLGLPILVFNGYKHLSQGACGWGMKMTIHLHLALRPRMSGVIPLLPSHTSVILIK
jgi:hypothetical protein